MAIYELNKLLPTTTFSDDDLVRLQRVFEGLDLSGGLKRALIGEHISGIAAFGDPAAHGITGWTVTISRAARMGRGVLS